MTTRHWLKMVASALLIFVIGLTITRALSAGGRKFESIFTENSINRTSELSIPLDGLAFLMNDRPLGKVQHVSLMRNAPAELNGMHFVVQLDKGVTADRFANCELTTINPAKLDKETKFTCVAEGDPGYDELVRFGTIDFMSPGHATQHHRFEVPESFKDQLESATSSAMATSGASEMKTSPNGDGNFQLTVDGRKVVDIVGNDAGGHVVILDPKTGDKIVDINGNDAGGNVVIRDPATGKNVLEVHGNNAGGTVKVNGVDVDAKATATASSANGTATAKATAKTGGKL